MNKAAPAIAKALKDARGRAGLSQYELARLSGVARISIAGIEMGKHASIRSSTAEKLAKALGLSTGELLQLGQSKAAQGKARDVDALLASFQQLKRGTVMVANAAEERWLRHQLLEWAGQRIPNETSLLFLLLALRHAA